MANAQEFVQRMREDFQFRRAVETFRNKSELWDFLKKEGFSFDECQLVQAMAGCMAQMDEG